MNFFGEKTIKMPVDYTYVISRSGVGYFRVGYFNPTMWSPKRTEKFGRVKVDVPRHKIELAGTESKVDGPNNEYGRPYRTSTSKYRLQGRFNLLKS